MDLRGANLQGKDLTGADLSEANLQGANLHDAVLTNAILYRTNLTECNLVHANLTGADLTETVAVRAGFGHAILQGATLFGANLDDTTFASANAKEADLRGASLQRARMRGAALEGALLSNSNLQAADLTGCHVQGATFDDANLRGARVKQLSGYLHASWIGSDILDVNYCGNYSMRRFVMDQNYLEEFRSRTRGHAILYWLWWLTSDCGRSFVRWGLWTFLIAALFSGLYTFVDIDYGDYETPLSPLYYSVVTLTTLGYGDVLPTGTGGQILVMVQVLLGYMMLGGMLSIFSNKMARRAD